MGRNKSSKLSRRPRRLRAEEDDHDLEEEAFDCCDALETPEEALLVERSEGDWDAMTSVLPGAVSDVGYPVKDGAAVAVASAVSVLLRRCRR